MRPPTRIYAKLLLDTLPDEKKVVTVEQTNARLGEVKEGDAHQLASTTAQRTVDCLQEVIERMMVAVPP